MRVAIGVIFVSLLGASFGAGPAVAGDNPASYSLAAVSGVAAAAPEAMQDAMRVSLAHPARSMDREDRRLASLDPSQIVYSQSAALTQQPLAQSALLDLGNGRLFPRQELHMQASQQGRTLGDFALMGFVALMLIVYQLRKKHRFLRPHPFSY